MVKRTKKQRQAIVDEALTRFEIAREAWSDVFESAMDDVRFVDAVDGQWDEATRTTRQGRPTMTFDKLSGAIDQTVGGHLQNRPSVKVRGAEDDDADTAEIYEGLIRQIEQRGSKAYKTGFKYTVKGGWGAWRVRHDFLDDDSVHQDIILTEVKNPFSVLVDPIVQTADLDRMRYGFVFDDMDKDEYEKAYPKAVSDMSTGYDFKGSKKLWMNDDTVRVCEYYRLVEDGEKTIHLLSDNRVVEEDEGFLALLDELAAAGITVLKSRTTPRTKLEHFKLNAVDILEEVDEVGKFVPLVPVLGKNSIVDGELLSRGLTRKGKDAQRLYNYERSTYVETVALQPKQPYFATANMIKGHEPRWKAINTSNDPVMLFNFDNGNKPFRQAPAQPSPALLTGLQISSDDIKSTTGIYDASLGARSNETSGRAIRERKLEGSTATFEFTDELNEAIEHTGRIYVDLIPKVYDGTRTIRILGEDMAEKVETINRPMKDNATGEDYTLNDLSRGKYDVKITVGPAYSTRRAETADSLAQIISQNPAEGELIGDIYYSSLDLVGADELVKRKRKVGIQRGFIEPNEEEKQEMAQASQGQQQAQAQQQQLQQAMQQAQLAKEQAETAKAASVAKLNEAKAISEQIDTAIKKQDFQGQQIAMQRMQALQF
tara:strand:+ start:186 stop:2156 length:1971 start_codon:yes stop_codon:yes gene_type:complete